MGSKEESMPKKQQLHVAMFPFLAFGHISPFVQLTNKLSQRDIKVSFFSAPTNIPRIQASLSPSSYVHVVPLTIPHVEGLPPGLESTADLSPGDGELLKTALDAMKPQVQSLLSHIRPHVVFFDFSTHWLPSLAAPLGIKTVFFSVFAAISTAYITVPSRKNPADCPPSVDDLKRPPPGFPACSAASLTTHEARDISYVFKSFDGPSVFERVVTCIASSSGTIVKSCLEMEAPYIRYVEAQFQKPLLLAGPVVPSPPTGQLESRWAEWLSSFPANSVVFCSFGSETFLPDYQIRELLLALEMAGEPFLAVLNFPKGINAASQLEAVLPKEYWERVKDKGVVHTGWVQQQHILAHGSVGCYVCHGGLSSVTEAIVNGCQLVLLPQKGDQFLNSQLVSRDLKAGIEVNRDDESGSFRKDDLCDAIVTVTKKVSEEPGKSIVENNRKWRDFLNDKHTHEEFTRAFVEKMEKMVYGDQKK